MIEGRLSALHYDPPIAKRRPKLSALITDTAGNSLPVVWHNQSYLRRVLENGQEWLLLGKVVWNWQRRQLELSNPQRLTQRGVLAIYPETAGISSAFLRTLIETAASAAIPDPISNDPGGDMSLSEAVRTIHCPMTLAAAYCARRRLALDELGMVQYVLRRQRAALVQRAASIPPATTTLRELVASLPFMLTDEQRQVSWRIIQQLQDTTPMRHILQGDVGTGKTIVAVLVALSVLEAGYDVCWMAPTQLLARQLADRIRTTLSTLPYDVALVIASEKTAVGARATLYVGTQALLSTELPRVGLVVIDEQHRFGVQQQEALAARHCHVLTMTATPIPRALLLSLYGEGASSQLTQRPVQQQPITTITLSATDRSQAITGLVAAVARGEQGFIITPRIEASQDPLNPFPSLNSILQRYQRAAPSVRFAAYHGNLRDQEQQEIMERFLNHTVDVLVATSIVEVGLDVPNATQMILEQAQWFGLAQLHQLRGRVGRGSRPATCYVLYEEELSDRLQAFAATTDGLALATMDLQLRGPGDLLGALQSGWGRLRLADPTDTALATEARALSDRLWAQPAVQTRPWLELYGMEEYGDTA